MFGFIADGLTVAITILFPIFASYKALHTSDPAILAPWLMYFVTLSLLTAFESTLDFILSWIPFYPWLRFIVHFYLLLPGSSHGAGFLYIEYIEPFLYHHEREIDDFITDAHDRAKKAGLQYFQQAVEWVKVNVLGFAPSKREPEPRPGQTYAQSFMSRFAMPTARGGADNLSYLVSQALSGASALYGASGAGAGAQTAGVERGAGAGLVPESIRNPADRLNYVASQRSRLASLLQEFDREQDNLQRQRDSGASYTPSSSGGSGGLSKSRSEAEFDRIEREEVSSGAAPPPYPVTPPAFERRASGGWMPWNWQRGAGGQPVQRGRGDDDALAYGKVPEGERGRSSGYDRGL
ncbi:uncharacterized protein EI97DRAFT_430020 [Westerdykella ornata]|uniref:Protein YOP1 n=1 Tax=Westerdykella ornata TaxID=318751 RepID=A0A6A6JVL8_WESOR|nr:uncharacterized protein EI97DRAFT_430020 [Westerdykella ornata]KAF2280275.1 hypothetical protein EI97DRAFT_430020 [Westerdykella ornata]